MALQGRGVVQLEYIHRPNVRERLAQVSSHHLITLIGPAAHAYVKFPIASKRQNECGGLASSANSDSRLRQMADVRDQAVPDLVEDFMQWESRQPPAHRVSCSTTGTRSVSRNRSSRRAATLRGSRDSMQRTDFCVQCEFPQGWHCHFRSYMGFTHLLCPITCAGSDAPNRLIVGRRSSCAKNMGPLSIVSSTRLLAITMRACSSVPEEYWIFRSAGSTAFIAATSAGSATTTIR